MYSICGGNLPERVTLIVRTARNRRIGQKRPYYKHCGPSFYLVSAVQQGREWVLPFPIEMILAWLWQRWEIEIAHREMKSGWGLGEKQCWNTRSAFVSVQWTAWVYAVFLLAGYRTWGLCHGPTTPSPWWPGAKRWSLSTLWRSFRSALWGLAEFRTCYTPSPPTGGKKRLGSVSFTNASLAASRI